jgi:hypothetical protein
VSMLLTIDTVHILGLLLYLVIDGQFCCWECLIQLQNKLKMRLINSFTVIYFSRMVLFFSDTVYFSHLQIFLQDHPKNAVSLQYF